MVPQKPCPPPNRERTIAEDGRLKNLTRKFENSLGEKGKKNELGRIFPSPFERSATKTTFASFFFLDTLTLTVGFLLKRFVLIQTGVLSAAKNHKQKSYF